MPTYNIPDYKLLNLESKLTHIQKKCLKYGNDFTFSKGEPFYKKVNISKIPGEPQNITIKFYPVEVIGTAKINNWEFVATLECHLNGNIIKRYNMELDIPEQFKYSENVCEHCYTKRPRTNLYVIRNTETDVWKQVGKSCLKSFTNGLSAEHVAAYMSAIELLEDSQSFDCVSGGGCTPYFEVNEVLCVAQAVINKFGYSKSDQQLPTKTIVSAIVKDGIESTEHRLKIDLPAKSTIYTDTALKMTQDVTNYYLSLDEDNEFNHNVKVILSERYCNFKNIGLLAYLPFGYKKAMEKMEREQKERGENVNFKYFGEIGKRYKNIPVTLSVLTSYDTDYGYTYIYKMADDNNHIFTWKTGKGFEPGNYIITMSVKDHKEYRGQKQTEVTRCKLGKIER